MADIRIKDLATTASVTASDDFMAVDGTTNGTRKLSAATPSFATSVTTPSLTSPASTNLTLGTGSFGTALTVASATGAATFAGAVSVINALTTANSLRVGNAGSNVYLAAENNTGGSFVVGSTAYAGLLVSQNPLQISVDNGSSVQATISSTGLALTGAATISSTTAGSSGAGALVVAGGLATGAASYIGGTLTATSSTNGNWNTQITNTSATGYGLLVKGGVSGVTNIAAFQDYLGNTKMLLTGAGDLTVSGTGTSAFAGAATFAGGSLTLAPAAAEATITAKGRATGTNPFATTSRGGVLALTNLDTTDNNAEAINFQNSNDLGIASIVAQNVSHTGRTGKLYFNVSNGAAPAEAFSIAPNLAATFAGAVAIGNTVNSVSPTSPNRTITMVVGGVTLYLAAKTTND